MFNRTSRFNKQNTRNAKQYKHNDNINWNAPSNIQVKFAEVVRTKIPFYAIGKSRDTGKEFVLDYEANFPTEARTWFDVEFNSLNADLVSVHKYN